MPKNRLALLFFLSLLQLFFSPLTGQAQAPEFLVRVGHMFGCGYVPPSMSILNGSTSAIGTWNDGSGHTLMENSVASVSGTTVTLDTALSVQDNNVGSGSICAGWKVELWTKHPSNVGVSANGSASGSFQNVTYGNVTFPYILAGTSYSRNQSNSGGPASGSGSETVNRTCSTTSSTQFSEYPGVTYWIVSTYTAYASVSVTGSTAYGEVSGTNTVNLSIPTSTPVAVITPETPTGSAGTSLTLTNASYDPDNPSGSQATCSASWSVTGPSGYSTNSSNNGSINFTPPYAGNYTATLTVTDNEGDTNQTQKTFFIRPATDRFPGSDGRHGEEDQVVSLKDSIHSDQINIPCGESEGTGKSASQMSKHPAFTAEAKVNAATGNASASVMCFAATRSSPLATLIQINSHPALGGTPRQTNMRNATYTYSIGFVNASGRYLVDADGTEFYLGSWSGTPTPPAGFFGTFQTATNGYKLIGAGPPGDIWQAGNWSYEFNGDRLYQITDPAGNIQEVTWGTIWGSYYPTQVEDLSTGRKLTFQYDSYPWIARIVDHGTGDYIAITYNGDDKVSSIQKKNSSGTVVEKVDITYLYQGPIYEVTKDGDTASKLTYSYSSQTNGVKLANISWSGGGTNINYFATPGSGATYRSERTTSTGGKIAYDYDSSGRLIRTLLPTMNGGSNPPTYTFQYDSNHNVTQISDGATTTDFTYNSKGKVTEIDDGNGGVWTFTYATNGVDLTEISDTIGTVLELIYGSSTVPHLPTTITDGDGNAWTKTYNSYGQVLTVVPPTGSPTGTTTYTYEENSANANYGYLKTVTNGAGDVTQFTGYTGTGNPTSIVQTPESGTNITYQFTYDAVGRVTRETQPDGKYRDFAYTYRKLSSITDEASTATSFTFCSVCGKLAGISAPLSKSLSWQQDGDHRTTGFTDARSNQTQYQYGNAGELKKVLYPDSSYLIYRYDDYGRLRETEDTRGNKQQYAYDASGRVETLTLVPYGGSSTDLDFTYYADGRLHTATDEVGTTTYTYTPGRLVSSVAYNYSASGLTNTQTVLYDYNPDRTLLSTEWKDGTTSVALWEYGYDGAGRMTSVENSFGETTSFTFDGVGKLKTQTNQNGTSLTYSWNQQRAWPTQILHKLGSTAFASYDLEYDGGNNTVGNLTEVTELDSSVVTYTYDALYRLTAESRTGTGSYTRSYGYDLAGNMTTYGGSSFASYDNTNKLSSLSGGSVGYDADGNMTAVSGAGIPSTTLTWDVRNKLLRQQTSTDDLTYRYDFTGKRVLRYPTGTSTKTFYVSSGDTLIGEVTSGSPSYAYTWGSAGLISQRAISTNESLWYHFGPQGETRQLTDDTGAVADTYRYDGYGRLTYSSGSDVNPFKYGGSVGYFQDGVAGMILATHRWYSAELARWLSRDPLGYFGGANQYEYVESDPIQFIDPKGLDAILDAGNFAAGFGDSLSEGLTGELREGDVIDTESWPYAIGGFAGNMVKPLLPTRWFSPIGRFAKSCRGKGERNQDKLSGRGNDELLNLPNAELQKRLREDAGLSAERKRFLTRALKQRRKSRDNQSGKKLD